MNVNLTKNGNQLTVAVAGRIDTATAPQLEEQVMGALDGVEELIFDFSDLIYISSAGLRLLLILHKKMLPIGSMQIGGVGEVVYEIFDVTGFSDILDISKK